MTNTADSEEVVSGANTCVRTVGRLVEIRLARGYHSVADVEAMSARTTVLFERSRLVTGSSSCRIGVIAQIDVPGDGLVHPGEPLLEHLGETQHAE